jgi:hypothetical protein
MVEPEIGPSDRADLADHWIMRGSRMSNEGDAAKIDGLLSKELVEVAATDDGWRKLYRHRATGNFWELSYPQSEMHGGGPRRLRELALIALEDWR